MIIGVKINIFQITPITFHCPIIFSCIETVYILRLTIPSLNLMSNNQLVLQMEGKDTEFAESQRSPPVLKTDATKCKVCEIGDLFPVKDVKSTDSFMIYTRDGTISANHVVYR